VPAGKVAVGDAPSALPVESHIEGDQVVIRADLPWVDSKDTRMAEGDRGPILRSAATVSLSQRDDTFGRREG
jgi:hypothetical protein